MGFSVMVLADTVTSGALFLCFYFFRARDQSQGLTHGSRCFTTDLILSVLS